ncbi:MAG: ATP synthase F1 subunit gamma [Bacteroidales bacterium]
MANLKEVRTRIESVNSTRQITSAMKMVAASKLRKSQNAIIAMRPYAAKLQELVKGLSASTEQSSEGIYSVQRPADRILIVPVTSNRGLCGAFNANVIRSTVKLINETYAQQLAAGNVSLFPIGKKGEEFFRSRKYNIAGSNIHVFDNLNFTTVVPIAEELMNSFTSEKFDRIIFIYNQFKNAGTQILISEQFLPVEMPVSDENDNSLGVDYLFEPGKEEILGELIPKTLKIQVYKVILDSFASEHGARMIAMHQATDNASDMLKELKLIYNKARQAAITNEIIEIVSGANAL